MRVNKPSALPFVCSQYEAVRQRFENWRQIRKPCTPIPEDLWACAVELAQTYGVSRTAQTLRLNYAALKQRLEASAPIGSAVPPAPPAFVELIPTIAAGMAAASGCARNACRPAGSAFGRPPPAGRRPHWRRMRYRCCWPAAIRPAQPVFPSGVAWICRKPQRRGKNHLRSGAAFASPTFAIRPSFRDF